MANIYQKNGVSVYDNNGKTFFAGGPNAGQEYSDTAQAASVGAQNDTQKANALAAVGQTPTTGNSTIANSNVRRFTASDSGSYATEADKIYSSLDITPPDATKEQQIKDQALKDIQGQLDAIDQKTASQLSDEAVRAADRSGQGRAINARSGVQGSDFGARRSADVEAVNKQARDAIYADQAAQKAAVIDKANQRAADLISAQKDQALKNADTYLTYLAQKQTEARNDIKSLATSGVALDTLSNDEYQKLLDQSGYGSQFLFESVYNSQLPQNQQKDYTYLNLGNGKVIRYDKQGGDPQEFDYSVPDGYQFKMAGDIPVFVNEATQDVKIAAPGGDLAAAAQYAKETELDTFTDSNGNRVSVMYNPVSKTTRKVVLGKAGSSDGSGFPPGFKPQSFEVSAVNQYISDQAKDGGYDPAADIKRAQSDPSFFYSTLNAILSSDNPDRYYKPQTIGIPVSVQTQ